MSDTKPTGRQLRSCWQEDYEDAEHPQFELVSEQTDPDDHGYRYTYTFKRLSDETFWQTSGVCQGGGNYHELRDEPDHQRVDQVWPHSVTSVEYRSKPPSSDA